MKDKTRVKDRCAHKAQIWLLSKLPDCDVYEGSSRRKVCRRDFSRMSSNQAKICMVLGGQNAYEFK